MAYPNNTNIYQTREDVVRFLRNEIEFVKSKNQPYIILENRMAENILNLLVKGAHDGE